MDFLDNIKEKTIIVCPSNVKKKVLNEINKKDSLVNIKLYSLEELKRIVLFDYDIKAVLYLMDKYNYSYDIASYYINNLYYVEDKLYNNDKLDFLVNLKKELSDNNLLTYNKLFMKSYKDTNFIVFGYDFIDSFSKKILSNFKYSVIPRNANVKENIVYKFDTLENELLFVINEIVTLINNGVDINNIYLLNLDSNYTEEVIRLFNMFKIPVDIDKSSFIINTIMGNKIFKYLSDSKSFEDTFNYMNSFEINKNNQLIFNSILNIFNKYVDLDYSFESILKCIKHDFESTKVNLNILKNAVRTGELYNSYYDQNDYVFLLGFNQGSIPKVIKDEDYISDDLKEILGLDSTGVTNKNRIKATIQNINLIRNITITYKKHYMEEEFYPSNLLNEKNFVESSDYKLLTENSLIYSNIKLAKMLDNLINYDEKNIELSKYFNSLDINYMDYDNSFKGLDKKKLYNYLNDGLVLSYTNIDSFYKCQFRFYIDSILKLNKYEESFDAFIGQLFHYVLSHVYDKDFDFEKVYSYFLKDKEFTEKEEFYIDKLKKELLIVCNNLQEFNKDTDFTLVFTEKNIKIDKSTDINVIFKGFVDKIMYKKLDDKTLVSIIDYKTGKAEIDLYNTKYGLGLQLIVYLYLISKSGLFEDYYCVGFYLQRILHNEINISTKKTYLEQKEDNLKLSGYSTNNRDYLKMFDKTYEKSKYIQSMSITKDDEFGRYSKVLDEELIKSIPSFVDKKINEARDKILNADFSINPKYIDGDKETVGCSYCRYKDLCFRKNEDIICLDKNDSLDFLKEGDIYD